MSRFLELTSYSSSPSPDALRNQWPAHWSDMTLFEWSLPLLSQLQYWPKHKERCVGPKQEHWSHCVVIPTYHSTGASQKQRSPCPRCLCSVCTFPHSPSVWPSCTSQQVMQATFHHSMHFKTQREQVCSWSWWKHYLYKNYYKNTKIIVLSRVFPSIQWSLRTLWPQPLGARKILQATGLCQGPGYKQYHQCSQWYHTGRYKCQATIISNNPCWPPYLGPVTVQPSQVWSANPEFSISPSPSRSNFSSDAITAWQMEQQTHNSVRLPRVAVLFDIHSGGPMSICMFYLTHGPHVLQVLMVLCEMIVPVDLQDELQVQVLPVGSVVDQVGIDPLPRLVIWRQSVEHTVRRSIFHHTETFASLPTFLLTWIPNVMRDDIFGLDRRRAATHQMEPFCQVLVNHTAS